MMAATGGASLQADDGPLRLIPLGQPCGAPAS